MISEFQQVMARAYRAYLRSHDIQLRFGEDEMIGCEEFKPDPNATLPNVYCFNCGYDVDVHEITWASEQEQHQQFRLLGDRLECPACESDAVRVWEDEYTGDYWHTCNDCGHTSLDRWDFIVADRGV